jgi:hypothetical protein
VKALAGLGPRLTGGPAERLAALYTSDALQKAGGEAWIETFPITGWASEGAAVQVRRGGKWADIAALPLGHTLPTPGRVEAELAVLDYVDADNPQLRDCAGKVILCASLWGEDAADLDALTRAKPAAVIFVDDRFPGNHPVQINMPMGWVGRLGVPAATVAYFDGWEMARSRPRTRVEIESRTFAAEAVNTVARFGGTNARLAPIVLCAHHDSVAIGNAADDDATGVACVLEIAKAVNEKPHARTVIACTFGCEEHLSVGAEAFVRGHPEVAANAALVVNFDSVGSLMGHTEALVTGSPRLRNWVERVVGEMGEPVVVERDVSPYSDHFFFTAAGAPAVWFYRLNSEAGRWFHHSVYDDVREISGEAVGRAARVGLEIARRLVTAGRLPFDRSVPDEQLAKIRTLERTMACWPPKRSRARGSSRGERRPAKPRPD